MLKNIRGFLLAEETIKTIITVLVIISLVYFIVSIYYKYSQTNLELKQAKTSLEYLRDKIEGGSFTADIFGPIGWEIFLWQISQENPSEDRGYINLMNTCKKLEGKSCICFCSPGVNGKGSSCSRLVCSAFPFEITSPGVDRSLVFVKSLIKIENPPVILVLLRDEEGNLKIYKDPLK